MTALNRCPFCGCIPVVDTSKWNHFEHQYEPIEIIEQRVTIYCPNCFCKKDITHTGTAELGASEKVYRKIAKRLTTQTIELMWNSRYSG